MAAQIFVAAGTNGAGKSSIAQPYIERFGGRYFNPDEVTRDLIDRGMPVADANAHAWQINFDMLRTAIDKGLNHAFETTLGGHSIALELMRALAMGRTVQMIYVGLETVDLHIERVAQRVSRGGHDIAEKKIRERFDRSRENLLAFIGTPAHIMVWDNSSPLVDGAPKPRHLATLNGRHLTLPPGRPITSTPTWAQPLLARALQLPQP